MFKTVAIAFSTALVAAASPALADTSRPAAEPAAATSMPAPAAQSTTPQRYCVKSRITGSMLDHKKCQTRAEWLKEGFDPLAKK